MSACESACDCDAKFNNWEHAPDCHSRRICDEGRYCDKHLAEAMADHAYLRDTPRHAVFNDAAAVEERNQGLRDAGRGHLATDADFDLLVLP